MRLISDWRRAWRYFSTQALLALAVIPLFWEALPPEAQMFIPYSWRPWIVAAVAIGGIAGRLVDQSDAE